MQFDNVLVIEENQRNMVKHYKQTLGETNSDDMTNIF